jgi:putative endopeptidase
MRLPIRSMILAAATVAVPPATGYVVLAAQSQPAEAPAQKHFGSWGVDLTGMDKAAKPGDDFDQFVNGAWKARTEIPSDQPGTGVGTELRDRIQEQIRSLIEQAPRDGQLGGMYRSFMDEATVERLDDKPLQENLERVAAIVDKETVPR